MSNSIFIFIFGLTLGILISVSLVSRYQRHIPEFQSESNPHLGKKTEPSRVGDVAPVNSLSKGPHPVIISNLSSETSFEAKLPEKPAASFWIPGREGAFLKFKNSDSSITTSPLVAGIDLISDFFSGNGKNSTDGSGHDSFSSSRRSHARSNAGEGHPTSNVRDISSKIRKGNSGKDEEGIQERVQSSSELDVSSLAGGQRANGKRKRGQKGSRGSLDRRGNSRNNNDSITDISGPGSSGTTGVSAGDDISLQSNFFNERGDRINPLIALMTKGGESDILYNHPPLQPYHIQSRRGHFLLPPYVPSLSSIIAQRAAMLQQEDKPIAGMEVLKRNNFSSG